MKKLAQNSGARGNDRSNRLVGAAFKPDTKTIRNMNNSVMTEFNTTTVQTTKKRRTSKTQKVYSVMTKARTKFNHHLTRFQNSETKRECIAACISDVYPDVQYFWGDFQKEIDSLENSKRYCESCTNKGLNPFIVAQHIIFLGKQSKKKAHDEGIDAFSAHGMYRESLFMGDRDSFDPKYFSNPSKGAETTEE